MTTRAGMVLLQINVTLYIALFYLPFRILSIQLIEKRRRDRINKSLNDLKNMIPTATERQVRQ